MESRSNRPKVRKFVLLKVAIFFTCILVVISSVCHLTDIFPNKIYRKSIGLFGQYSGMGNRYAFFAPRPGLPRRVIVRLYHPNEKRWSVEQISWNQGEAMKRVETMYHHFQEGNFLREYAASWSAWYFGQHPDATVAIVEHQYWKLPPLRAETAQDEVEWVPLKIYSFARNDREINPD